jgi:hypothetical protein
LLIGFHPELMIPLLGEKSILSLRMGTDIVKTSAFDDHTRTISNGSAMVILTYYY